MKLLKHMEAVFVATATLAVLGTFALHTHARAEARATTLAHVAVPTVVVKAKRMTAAEKVRSLQAERAAVASASAADGRL